MQAHGLAAGRTGTGTLTGKEGWGVPQSRALEKQIARCGYPQRARLGQESLRNWSVLTGGNRLA